MSRQDLLAAAAKMERWREWTQLAEEHGPWDFLVTNTFRRQVPDDVAKGTTRIWLRELAKLVGGHVNFLVALERNRNGDHPHIHGLLAPRDRNARLKQDDIHRLWRAADGSAGITRIVRYQPGRNGAAYVVKGENVLLNVACPRVLSRCRRSGGCAEAPGPWHW